MGSRLKWEAATRSERAARQGTEPFYRDLSASDSASEIARTAFESAAKRAVKNARKEGNACAPNEARRRVKHEQKKREQNRKNMLEVHLFELVDPSWAGKDALYKERVILRIDSLLDEIGRGHVSGSALVRAHTAIVSYMDTVRDSKLYMRYCESEGFLETDLINLGIDDAEQAIDYVAKYVARRSASHLSILHGNINLSLKGYCPVTAMRKHAVVNQLLLRRVIAITPSMRVLYYSKYRKAKSN